MKKSIHAFTYICCIAVLALASCKGKPVQGDGNVISHEVPIEIYSEIKVEGAIDIVYNAKPDEAAYLRIEADDNIIPLIDVKVKGRSLTVKAKESINPSRFVIYTNSPSLKYVESKGASNITLQGAVAGDELKIEMKGTGNFKADNLVYDKAEFQLRGAGNMDMSGQVHKAKIDISGSGDVKASDLAVNEMEAIIRGSGNIEINVLDKLSAEIKGKGTIAYKGNPQITKNNIKGAGVLKVLQ